MFLEEGYRQSERAGRLPRLCSDAIAGAIYELMYHHAVSGRTAQMAELTPQCAYVALAPFIGAAKASQFVEHQTRARASEVRRHAPAALIPRLASTLRSVLPWA